MDAIERYGETDEGVLMNRAGDMIYEAYKMLKEAADLMDTVKGPETLEGLIKNTKAECMKLGDLSDSWTETVFERIQEVYPPENKPLPFF